MENIIINETPVRTSKNFRINNIEIDSKEIPEKIGKFKNIYTSCETAKDSISFEASKPVLKFGLGNVLTNQAINDKNKEVRIEVQSRTDKNISVDFIFNKANKQLVENIEIIAKENTKSTIIIKYQSEDETKSYHNGIITLKAHENAEVDIVIINFLNKKSCSFLSIENSIYANSKVKYTIIDFGGKLSISNYYSNIIGENASNNLNTIYIGNEKQIFDFNYIGELYGEKSNIDIEVQGALKDSASKRFKGTIDFKKGCKKAKGNENESCMLLSDKAKSLALPMLLCSEEDVEGNHSSSSGKVGEKELFYIMTRGFDKTQAEKLLVRARFNSIISEIADEKIREEILEQIDNKLEQ